MGSIEDADMPVLIAEMPERATPEDTEVVFDAMPIAELASTWGALQRPGRRDQMIAVWPAILYFNRLPHRQPERALDLVLDLREDPEATGFYIWQFGLDSTAASERIVGDLRAKGYPIEADMRKVLFKPRDGIIAAPMWGLTLMRTFDHLTLSGYIRQNTSYVVYSVVTPTRDAKRQFVRFHSRGWMSLSCLS